MLTTLPDVGVHLESLGSFVTKVASSVSISSTIW